MSYAHKPNRPPTSADAAATVFGDAGPQYGYEARALFHLDWDAELAHRLPELTDAVARLCYQQLALVTQVSSDGTHDAVRILFIQAVNDLNDLLSDVQAGAGRSAMRAARVLVEHAINLRTISEGLPTAQRYLDHLAQGRSLLFDLRPGADRLSGNEHRSYIQALRRTGLAAKRAFDNAVALHGPSFRKSWVPQNIADRARRHGLEEHYEFYRLCSLVAHGAAGGSLGSVRDDPSGKFRTFRSGLALELAPVAMWGGLRAYREVLNAVADLRPDLNIDVWGSELAPLEGLWPKYYATIRALDDELWPEARLRPSGAVMAFGQNGKTRWYLHIPSQRILFAAHEPELEPDHCQHLDRLIKHVLAERSDMFSARQRLVTVRVEGVTVTPDGSGRWIPETGLLEVPAPGVTFVPVDIG